MILRRLAAAIAGQNWSIVALEIAIVVIGIFLGLRVNEWSQDRANRQAEIIYLERISEDLKASLRESERMTVFQTRLAGYGALALEALESCELDAGERDEFASAIYLAAKHSMMPFVQASIQELLSSGRLTLISNAVLRQELVEILQTHDDYRFYMSDLQLRVSPHVNYVDSIAPIIVTGPIAGASDVSWEMLNANFEQLCADRRFFTAMASSINYTWDATATLMSWSEQLTEIRNAVGAELAALRSSND